MLAAEADERAAHVAVPDRSPLAEQVGQEDQAAGSGAGPAGPFDGLGDRQPGELGEPRERRAACLGRAGVQVEAIDLGKLTTPAAGRRSRESSARISEVPATSIASP